MRLPRLFRTTESNESLATCFCRTQPRADSIFRVQVDMRVKLRGKVVVNRSAVEETAKPCNKSFELMHSAPYVS